MDPDLKALATILAIGTVFCFGMFASCNASERNGHETEIRKMEIDSAAPIVESCIKHPATRLPLTGRQ